MLKVGLIKEQKVPTDNRVALTPTQCVFVQEKFNVQISVQASETRCFTNEEYIDVGINVVENIHDCDILLGIKEVPISSLIQEKNNLIINACCKLFYNKKIP
ncbi:MAG: hypothetical protein ACOVNY_05975 [Chitinophagaceae bacterium]